MAPAQFYIDHGVHCLVGNKGISDPAAVKPKIEALVVAVFKQNIIAQAVVRPSQKKRFSEFKAEKAAPVEPIRVFISGILMAVATPDTGEAPAAGAQYGFFALGEN